MSKKYNPVTLHNPKTGKTWRAETKEQEVNLLNHGWAIKPAEKKADAPSNKSVNAPKNK